MCASRLQCGMKSEAPWLSLKPLSSYRVLEPGASGARVLSHSRSSRPDLVVWCSWTEDWPRQRELVAWVAGDIRTPTSPRALRAPVTHPRRHVFAIWPRSIPGEQDRVPGLPFGEITSSPPRTFYRELILPSSTYGRE